MDNIADLQKEIAELEREITRIDSQIENEKATPETQSYTDANGQTRMRTTYGNQEDNLYNILSHQDIKPEIIERVLEDIEDFSKKHPDGQKIFQEDSTELREASRTIRDLSTNLVEAAINGKDLGKVLQNMVKDFTTQVMKDMTYFIIWNLVTGGQSGMTSAGTGIFGHIFSNITNNPQSSINTNTPQQAQPIQEIHLTGEFKIKDKDLIAQINQYNDDNL